MLRTPRTFGEWITACVLAIIGLTLCWYILLPFLIAVIKQTLAMLLVLAIIGFGGYYAFRNWWNKDA